MARIARLQRSQKFVEDIINNREIQHETDTMRRIKNKTVRWKTDEKGKRL